MRNLLEPEHLLAILLVVVVMFGGQRIPEIGAALGRGVRDFRRGADGTADPEPLPPATSAPSPAARAAADAEREPKRLLLP